MSLPATGCNLTQTIASCADTPTWDQQNAHLAHAYGELFRAYFHAGAPAVLALLVVLYLLSRVLAWGSVFVAGLLAKPRKEE